MSKQNDGINQRIIPIVTEIAQNNPPVQKQLLQTKFLDLFLSMLDDPNISQVSILTSLILHNDFRRLDQSVLGLFRRL
jgi:hypothetical protein